jgi:hypothetical protein
MFPSGAQRGRGSLQLNYPGYILRATYQSASTCFGCNAAAISAKGEVFRSSKIFASGLGGATPFLLTHPKRPSIQTKSHRTADMGRTLSFGPRKGPCPDAGLGVANRPRWPNFAIASHSLAKAAKLWLTAHWIPSNGYLVGPPGLEPGTKGFACAGGFLPERTISSPSARCE